MRWDFRTAPDEPPPVVPRDEFLRVCEAFLARGLQGNQGLHGDWVYWIAVDEDRILSHIFVHLFSSTSRVSSTKRALTRQQQEACMASDAERRTSFWTCFKNVAIFFSLFVNLILVVVLLVVVLPLVCELRGGLLEPILTDLDAAFVSLGEATIDTTVPISESVPIRFILPLDESLPIDFDLSIDQNTTVVLNQPVPLNAPATFRLPGGGGSINGTVSLSLPPGMALPVRLSIVVPVSQTVPVQLDVPVDRDVPIQLNAPVQIELGQSGLGPVVAKLRASLEPAKPWMKLLDQICGLPEKTRAWVGERLRRDKN